MELVRKHDKSSETFGFVLNFLWLLSLFQDKESNKQRKKKTFLA